MARFIIMKKNRLIKILFFSVAILMSNTALAQYRLKQLDTVVGNLQKRGLDTILIYMQGNVWHTDSPAKDGGINCHCLKSDLIYDVDLIYIDHGKVYKLNYRCCKQTDTTRLTNSLSIQYFLVQKQTLVVPRNYFSRKMKFPPPMPTDQPFEYVELITPKNHFRFELNSFQSGEGYKIWKQYPWINKQIRLVKLIKQDLSSDKKSK